MAVVGFTGGLVDSIAGGGGLITLPALLWAGLPPHLALGTNRFGSSFGSFTAAVRYIRGGVVDLQEQWFGVLCTGIGAVTGALTVQSISAGFLKYVIPALLAAVFFTMLFRPKLGKVTSKQRISTGLFHLIFGLSLGFYDGFFGPGTGSFWTMAILLLLGLDLLSATGKTKIMNFASNIASLVVFVIGGQVVFQIGLVMGLGQVVGATIGSGLVMKNGVAFIKPVFMTMVFLVMVKLWYDTFFR